MLPISTIAFKNRFMFNLPKIDAYDKPFEDRLAAFENGYMPETSAVGHFASFATVYQFSSDRR